MTSESLSGQKWLHCQHIRGDDQALNSSELGVGLLKIQVHFRS